MTEKIYGVYGLMEWDALIVCGKARLRVKFEGGTSSGFGDSPAIYRTSNPAAQHIIESSGYFKEKRIRLLRVAAGKGDNIKVDALNVGITLPADSGANSSSSGKKKCEGKSSPASPLLVEDKDFSDPQAARRFLHETHGVALEKLLTVEDIREMGKIYGFNMIW